MNNDIDLFMRADTDKTYAGGIFLTVMGAGGLFLTPFMAIPLFIGIVMCVGMFTCISKGWTRGEIEYDTWKQYRSLPKEYQRTIGLSPEAMSKFNTAQWRELKSKVSTINDNLSAMAQYASLPDEASARIDMIIERDREELNIRRQVTKELNN